MRLNLPKTIIIGLAIIIVCLPAFFNSYQTRYNLIDLCDRSNIARVSELRQRQNLLQNAKSRAQDTSTMQEGKDALERAKRRKQELIDSVSSVAAEEGSVIVDCKKAHPAPFPFNLFIS